MQLRGEKEKLMHAVGEMKRTGKFDRQQLVKYGIDLDSPSKGQMRTE